MRHEYREARADRLALRDIHTESGARGPVEWAGHRNAGQSVSTALWCDGDGDGNLPSQ